MASGDISSVQLGTTIPLAYGPVRATGQKLLDYTTAAGMIVQAYGLAEGEWDGPDNLFNGNAIWNEVLYRGTNYAYGNFGQVLPGALFFHFHPGVDTPVGTPFNPVSNGSIATDHFVAGDNLLDELWSNIPNVVTQLMYSRLAYYFLAFNPNSGTTAPTLSPVGDWRTTRCRIFDANGVQIQYGYTLNPAWHFVDSWCRRVIKPEYTIVQGVGAELLTKTEAACFDWQSIAEAAAYYDELLANGKKRFEGAYAFASTATLASIHEQILLNCRSYQQEYAGKISLMCDKPRPSVFLLDERHIIPSTFKVDQQDVHSSGNRFMSTFLDLNLKTVASIATISRTTSSSNGSVTAQIVTTETNPCAEQDVFHVRGAADDSFNGVYYVTATDPTNKGITATSYTLEVQPDGQTTGGLIGYQQVRFLQRTPELNHRQAQLAGGRILPDAKVRLNRTQVQLDFASMTYDQQNRLLQYEMIRALGVDAAPWKPPVTVSVSAWLESVDDQDRILKFMYQGDCLDLTDRVSWEWAGKYELVKATFHFFNWSETTPGQGTASGGTVDLVLRTMTDDRFVDVSNEPSASYATLPNDTLWAGGAALNSTYQASYTSLSAVVSGSYANIKITGVQIAVGGNTPLQYGDTEFDGEPFSTTFYLYVNDPNLTGNAAVQATLDAADFSGVKGCMYITSVTTPADPSNPNPNPNPNPSPNPNPNPDPQPDPQPIGTQPVLS